MCTQHVAGDLRNYGTFGSPADAWVARSAIELKNNTVIVVLGASGDLAKKKTVCPPLAHLCMAID